MWATHAAASCRGLCNTCRCRRDRNGTVLDIERLTMSAAEVLDEWDLYAYDSTLSYTANVKLFAARLQRPHPTIEKALSRAGIRAGAA